MNRTAERVWYWAAGVLAASGFTAFVEDGHVVCARWNFYDQRWDVVQRPIADFEEKAVDR